MEKLLTIEEVAEILGLKKSGIYGLVFEKRIPHIKLSGRVLRFRESDIEAWVKSRSRDVVEVPPTQPAKRRGRPPKNGGNKEVRIMKIVPTSFDDDDW